MRYRSIPAACLVVLCVAAAAAEPGGFVAGTTLEQQLSSVVSISWSNIPLAQALKSLSVSQHLAIVLDRRIDPQQPIQLTLSQEPLQTILQRIGQHLKLGYCQLGPVAYFGPPLAARRLRTLAALRLEEVRPLGAAGSRKLLVLRTSHWDDLAEPRRLLSDLAEEAGVKIIGAEKIPHDLWPAADLPPLTWIDRLTLLAAQFDLAFRIDKSGQEVELLSMPARPVLSRTYQAGRDGNTLLKRWAKALPHAQLALEGNKIRLDGLLEDHELVEHRLRGTPTQRTTVTAGKEVYQLSIQNTALDQVVRQLGQRLNLEFQWDRAAIDTAGITIEQLISVKVQNASLDELMRAVLQGTGLTFRRKDRAISIYPAESSKPERSN